MIPYHRSYIYCVMLLSTTHSVLFDYVALEQSWLSLTYNLLFVYFLSTLTSLVCWDSSFRGPSMWTKPWLWVPQLHVHSLRNSACSWSGQKKNRMSSPHFTHYLDDFLLASPGGPPNCFKCLGFLRQWQWSWGSYLLRVRLKAWPPGTNGTFGQKD